MQAIQGFQVEFPTQIVERDYFDPRRRPIRQGLHSNMGNGGVVGETAEEKKTIEMGAMGMSKVVSMPVNCGYYSAKYVGHAARSVAVRRFCGINRSYPGSELHQVATDARLKRHPHQYQTGEWYVLPPKSSFIGSFFQFQSGQLEG